MYDWPAVTAEGVMVKAIGAVWARAATTMDAPTKRVRVKCMFDCDSVPELALVVEMEATVVK